MSRALDGETLPWDRINEFLLLLETSRTVEELLTEYPEAS